MDSNLLHIPFVDLSWQNEPLLADIDKGMRDVMARGDFILGKEVREFEADFAQACGVKYGIGVGSGTDAIALGLRACGIMEGDEIIVPANTFIATVIGVILAGAKPVLADCDINTALMDLELAQKVVTEKTKAIIPVHLYGQMVSPQKLKEFAQNNNLIIFEDSAQAHLAQREGKIAGSVGLASGFSFYPSKNLGAFGNGGMVVTDNQEIAQKLRSLRNYGAPKKYYHQNFGTNSRLNTLQGVVLKVKLPYLRKWNNWRNQAGAKYNQLLKPLAEYGITPIKNVVGEGHIYHLYVINVKPSSFYDRNLIQDKLNEVGIQTGIHYPIPCHLQPAYGYLGYQKGDFPNAESLCDNILSLPMYPGITDEQLQMVSDKIKEIVKS
ncbi:DegT/DnrJ/EryC1/StrS family aminotransferase [Cyanobacterium stanieri LEGE 03274]|uniref:DegT/DnrJ/EryC1/StrS family aminotransferase n=1 Tax=Cyanobacterium stanieri LEGE 03274 TaxID=1828756 RepID=A0ABR9VA76_9CHRO|nr:DegT/DnrJ/EryC1/StrS family aminotransferase [Cyanobacterium stanieri]MBE9223744.1 DegT/DnrJ/EryC1/StrS family aminotransferase [Cyanobacterium stanieri LEGE 03274]